MKICLKIFAVTIFLLVILSSAILQGCQAGSTEQTTKNTYQSFLTNVLGVDLTKYNMTNSGYGVHYPPALGGIVKEETVSYTLDSGKSKVDTWCVFDNGVMTVCSLTPTQGSVIYAQSPTTNILDATKNFIQKYQAFATQFFSKDTSYLLQAISSLDGVNDQTSTDKREGNVKLTISPSPPETSIEWTYTQNNVNMTFKNINLKFVNSSICWFGDTWNLFSVSTRSPIPEDDAKSFAFATAQNYDVSVASVQGSSVTSLKVKPDWSNMTYEATLEMIPGETLNWSLSPVHDVYPSNTTRDPLTLYPLWHFIFYFSKPIGDTVGLEVGVWGDTKEIVYCHEYGFLGGLPQPNKTPQQTNGQSSNGTGQNGAFRLQPEFMFAVLFGVATAIVIGCYLIIWKRDKQ